ncbi:MAG: hypothetical protein KME03_08985 [Aphanocapsa lilacina HA4352-LM1]|jgi:hypothetical protein|nr:hypothetical protein [Aphanocapsa lilacina HA4352-LM1]
MKFYKVKQRKIAHFLIVPRKSGYTMMTGAVVRLSRASIPLLGVHLLFRSPVYLQEHPVAGCSPLS